MLRLPRLALGSVQPHADTHFVAWALSDLFTRRSVQVQHFLSRCCFVPFQGAQSATGLGSRHLDSWLMSSDVCRELLVRGTGDSEIAIVEGRYDAGTTGEFCGGSLDRLCHWLDLPRMVVLDAALVENCRLPERPAADALILDCVSGADQFYRLQTSIEALWGIPVLGALEALPRLRAAVRSQAGAGELSRDICEELGCALARYTRPEAILRLAARRDLPDGQSTLFPAHAARPAITVAMAYDEAFHCYFPDALDLLEALGASIVDFSPLHDEGLPPDADLVYIGCGHPERFAAELSQNHCMMSALRNHLCAGRRIYADGGGLAYLCQYVETPEGLWAPMVGALPAIARRSAQPAPPRPVELTLTEGNWLAAAGATIRGYLNTNWNLEPNGQWTSCFAQPGHEHDMVGRYQALGSRLQVNFATHPGILHHFVKPMPAKTSLAGLGAATR